MDAGYFFTEEFRRPSLERCRARLINTGWVLSLFSAGAVGLSSNKLLLLTDKGPQPCRITSISLFCHYLIVLRSVTCPVTAEWERRRNSGWTHWMLCGGCCGSLACLRSALLPPCLFIWSLTLIIINKYDDFRLPSEFSKNRPVKTTAQIIIKNLNPPTTCMELLTDYGTVFVW